MVRLRHQQLSRQILNDAKRVVEEVGTLPRRRKTKVRKLQIHLQTMVQRVRSVVRQTKDGSLKV